MSRSLYDAPAIYAMLHDGHAADLPFYRDLATRADGPILEVGAGTGRVSLDLAARGHRVRAIERELDMVEAFRRALDAAPPEIRARVELLAGDVVDLALAPEAHSLAIAPFNVLAHLHDDETFDRFVGAVRRALRPGAIFAFDVWTPLEAGRTDALTESPRFRDPRTNVPTRSTERRHFDPATSILHLDLELTTIDGDRESLALALRVYEPEALRASIERHGFELLFRSSHAAQLVAGRIELEPLEDRGEHIVHAFAARRG